MRASPERMRLELWCEDVGERDGGKRRPTTGQGARSWHDQPGHAGSLKQEEKIGEGPGCEKL